MNVLVTGPSCAGKTTYCRSRTGCRLVELDLLPPVGELEIPADGAERCLFEGLPSGSDKEIAGFAAAMDRVFVLDTAFDERLRRIIEKDGPLAFGCFLYNEYAWRTYLLPIFGRLPQTRTLAAGDLPDDPFSAG